MTTHENAATACQEISRFIDETGQSWSPQELPSKLFHYTTVEGFIGIITSESLWVSDMLSLNDASEASYPFKIITEALNAHRSDVPEEHRRRFETQLTEYLFTMYTPFVACFCEDGDLLSQWKGYGNGGEGFALEVSSSWLLSLDSSIGFRLQRVIYDVDQQVGLVRMLLDHVSSLLARRSFSDQEQREVWQHAAASLAPWVVMFKDPAFREELEWRLVNVKPIPPPYSFRRSGHRIVPYVKIPVSDCQAITRVVRGPYFSGTETRGAYIMTVSHGFILGATFHDSKVPLRR